MSELFPVEGAQVRARAAGLDARRVLVVAIVGAVILATVSLGAAGATRDDPQETIREGIDLMYRVTIADPGSQASEVSDAKMREHKRTIPGRLGKFFAGPALSSMSKALDGAMTTQIEDGTRDTKGGAKQVEIVSFEGDGDSANAVARALIWLRTESKDSDKVIESDGDWWVYTIHLIRTDDGWRIDELDAIPEGGTSP